MSDWLIGPGPEGTRRHSGGIWNEIWDVREEFDQPPGTTPCPPSSVVFTAGFNTAVFRTTSPMPKGFRNGYLYMTGAGGGSYAWNRLESAGYTVDGPGLNTGIEIAYRAMVDNGSIDVSHHRAPRMAVLTTGGLTCYHIKKDYAKIGVHADNGGVNEVLSAERQGPFDWSGGKWVWNRIKIINWRMWFKAWNDTDSEPGWLFENYDLSALGGLPATNYIYRIGNWHSECKVGLANFAYRLLNQSRELLIQHDNPITTQTFNPPPSSVTHVDFTLEEGKYIQVYLRRTDDTHAISVLFDTDKSIQIAKHDGSTTTLAISDEGYLEADIWYETEIELNGKYITVRVNGVEALTAESNYNMSTVGGKIVHTYVTNDIMLKVYS